ncbi:MAG: MarC family protein [Victivallaceae bacterium]|nr:MarC family protein [Victivallaceae bacterium]
MLIASLNMMVRLIWMLTPFFVLAMFLNMTEGLPAAAKQRVAVKCTVAVFAFSLIFYFLGRPLFDLLGITLDGFRIGAGVTLFITALGCISGSPFTKRVKKRGADEGDFSIVPLAIPFAVGPGMIGMIMISAIEDPSLRGSLIFVAAATMLTMIFGAMLIFASVLRRALGDNTIHILSRITGLFLAALAGQMVVEGVRNIWIAG